MSIKADGTDVRTALKSLFQQSGKNYVLEPGIYFALYVSLDNVDFDEAMGIICHLAKLKTDVRDGIYYVMPDHGSPAQGPVTGAGTGNGQGSSSASAGSSVSGSSVLGGAQGSGAGILDTKDKASTGVVTAATLYQRKVTVRFTKTDIRKVFAELGKQSSVTINVDSNVPAYKLDVVLKKTSLRYALNKISQAAGLVYVLENGQVRIGEKAAFKKVALNR